MNTLARPFFLAGSSILFTFATLATLAPMAHADDARAAGPVTIVSATFGDHLEQGHAVGDAKSIKDARKVIYFLDAANTGDEAQITLVWSVDGKEVQRQSLDVGRSHHWHTWGSRPIRDAHTVEVTVLDASGNTIESDSLALGE